MQINTQLIPPSGPLLANMPSGREIHTPKQYIPPSLDEDTLARMRAPPDGANSANIGVDSDDSSNEDVEGRTDLPGAFPSTTASGSNYY